MTKKYVICDIEATGLGEGKEIIEIALITWQFGKVSEIYETLINPLKPVSEYISQLTTISNRDLILAPKFYEVAEAIKSRLDGAIFVSHNTDFDLSLLKDKFSEMGDELNVKSYCTLKAAQHEIPGLKNYNLDALCIFFGIKIKERHRAIGDALATLELFKELKQLHLETNPKILHLPHHQQAIKKLSSKAGILTFHDQKGRKFRQESTFNLQQTASDLLAVKPENRELIRKTQKLSYELTGLALIADFKTMMQKPSQFHWTIVIDQDDRGEKKFKIKPLVESILGLWYFRDFFDAKKKLRYLNKELDSCLFIYREGVKSKEEILRHNQKVDELSRDARFSNDHLILLGQGRTLKETSFVVIRNSHVIGYGYTDSDEDAILAKPENYLTRRFTRNIEIDMATIKYLKILKNKKNKKENLKCLTALELKYESQKF